MAGDLAAVFGDPGPVRGGRDEKRGEVLGQEAGIAIQGVNVADQAGAGGEVAIAARAYQHAPIVACQRGGCSAAAAPLTRDYVDTHQPGLRYRHVAAQLVRCGLLGEAILQASVPELIDRPDGAQDIALTGVVEEPQ
jgi:hypothetical protein